MGSLLGTARAGAQLSLCWGYSACLTVVVLPLPQPTWGCQALGWVCRCLLVSEGIFGNSPCVLCGWRRRGTSISTSGQSQAALCNSGSAGSLWPCGLVNHPNKALHGPHSAPQDTHLEYIMAAAHLFAQSHKIPPCSDRASAQTVLRSVVLPPFVPQEGFQIHLAEDQEEVPAGEALWVPQDMSPGSRLQPGGSGAAVLLIPALALRPRGGYPVMPLTVPGYHPQGPCAPR